MRRPPLPPEMGHVRADRGGYFQKLSQGSETSDITSEGLWEILEGDSADICAGKFSLMLMGGRAEGLDCADTGARNPQSFYKVDSGYQIKYKGIF